MPSLEDLSVDELLQRAKATEQSDLLLAQLANNPATREETLRLVKKLRPALSIPEIDAKDAVLVTVETSNKRIEALEQQLQTREIHDRIRNMRETTKTKYKLDESDLAGVEALMVDPEAPISNYDAAARVYLASRQAAVPNAAAMGAPTFDMPAMDIWKNAKGNSQAADKIGITEAFKALKEFRSGNVQ